MKLRRGAALVLLPAVSPALAHSPIEGIGDFYGGLLHPLLVPAHLLVLVLGALLIGQGGVTAMRWSYPAAAVGLLLGLLLAPDAAQKSLQPVLLVIAICCGLLVACATQLPVLLVALLTGLAALAVGLDSNMAPAEVASPAAAAGGAALGALLVVVMLAGIAEMLSLAWQTIAVRVVASWGSAAALLVLALELRS